MATIETSYNTETKTLAIATIGCPTLMVVFADLSPEIIGEALAMGLRKKITDAAAIERDTATGKPATARQKFEAMEEVFARITGKDGEAPSWNKTERGNGNGNGNGEAGLLFRALLRVFPDRTEARTKEWLAGKTLAEQAKLRKSERIAAVILEIKAEDARKKGKEGGDEEGLFEGL